MASILRTLVEDHDYALPEAVRILRQTLDAEESEAGKTKAVNFLLMGASGLGVLASMTNPIGLIASAIALGINWSCQQAHRKDYGKIRDEQSFIHHAPLILDAIVQYDHGKFASESTLIAAYEHCLSVFDDESGTCVSASLIEGTTQYQHSEFLPLEYFRSSIGSAIVQEDPVMKLAGKTTGIDRMYERMGIQPPQTVQSNRQLTPTQEARSLPIPEGVPMPPEPIEEKPTIGNNTRLNAVEVRSTSTQSVQSKPRQTALDALLASPFVSRAFFGAQRTGKSYLAAIASRELHQSRKTKTYHINLLSYTMPDPGVCEDDLYWNHAVKSVRGDLPTMNPEDAIPLIEDAIALVEEWFKQSNAILIVDEWAYTGSLTNSYSELLKPLLKMIADKISALASGGIKRGQAIWTISPEFVAGTLTQDARAIKKLQLCYVTIAPNRYIDWNGSRIGFNGELYDQVKNNYPIAEPNAGMGCDRICYVDNRWMPVGELPSISNPPQSKPSADLGAVLLERFGGNDAKK